MGVGLGVGQIVAESHSAAHPNVVPFCLWVSANHLDDYQMAIIRTIRGGGDIDTNCAIVGGIVALAVGREGIPVSWLADREELVV